MKKPKIVKTGNEIIQLCICFFIAQGMTMVESYNYTQSLDISAIEDLYEEIEYHYSLLN